MSKIAKIFTIAIIALLALTSAYAQQDKIDAQKRKIATLEQQVKSGEKQIASLRKDRSAKESRVRSLATQVSQRGRLLSAQEDQIKLISEQITLCDSTMNALGSDLEQEREAYAQMVRDAYRSYRANTTLSYLFTSDNFVDATRRMVNIRSVAQIRKNRMERIDSLSYEVETQKISFEQNKQELDSVARDLSYQKSRLQRDINVARDEIKSMSSREREQMQQRELRQKQLDGAIAELRKLTAGNTEGASFTNKTTNLNLPVVGGKVKRYMENMAEITGAKGAKIISIYDGKVVEIKQNRITNNYDVYIAHGDYITSYAGLSSVSVAKGAKVAKSQSIGIIGSAINITTMQSENKIVFGIYPPNPNTKMRASECFSKR